MNPEAPPWHWREGEREDCVTTLSSGHMPGCCHIINNKKLADKSEKVSDISNMPIGATHKPRLHVQTGLN